MSPRPMLPAAPFLVGARFVCTKCRTRGVTRMCGCGARVAAVDLLAPAGKALAAELTKAPKTEGAPTRDELFWGGLKSRLQWLLSAIAAIAVGVWVASNESAWGFQKAAYALAEVVLLTLLFRLPMLALALMFRLVVTSFELVLAGAAFVVGKLAKSHRLEEAAGNWLARAERTLRGDYFWRRSMVPLRGPPVRTEGELRGALLPSEILSLQVGAGERGALVLRDAEVPSFRAVLATGETIMVAIDAGSLVLPDGIALEPSAAQAQSPLLPETRRACVPGATAITLQGGEWQESEQEAGYRAPLEPRTLRGTDARPLSVVLGSSVGGDDQEAHLDALRLPA